MHIDIGSNVLLILTLLPKQLVFVTAPVQNVFPHTVLPFDKVMSAVVAVIYRHARGLQLLVGSNHLYSIANTNEPLSGFLRTRTRRFRRNVVMSTHNFVNCKKSYGQLFM